MTEMGLETTDPSILKEFGECLMKYVGLLVLCSVLAACSSSKITTSAERDYLKAYNGPVVVVPPPLSNRNIRRDYILPTPSSPGGASIVPPPLL